MSITRFEGPDAGGTRAPAGGVPVSAEERPHDFDVIAFLRSVVASGEPLTDVDVDNIEAALRVSVPTEPGAPDPREEKVRGDFDAAVEDVHRAFCDPQHELVGEWDRDMAEAIRRNGYALVRSRPVPAPEPSAQLIAAARAVVAAVVDDESGMQTFDFALIDDLGDALDDLEA
jgi:hypothetical protein